MSKIIELAKESADFEMSFPTETSARDMAFKLLKNSSLTVRMFTKRSNEKNPWYVQAFRVNVR